jgi:hypothetical protein
MSKAISISSKRHEWKSLYLAALLDVNENRLPERIAKAEAAIMQREAELRQVAGDHIEEQQYLDDAMYALGALRRTAEMNRSMRARGGEWEATGT